MAISAKQKLLTNNVFKISSIEFNKENQILLVDRVWYNWGRIVSSISTRYHFHALSDGVVTLPTDGLQTVYLLNDQFTA